MYLPTWNIPIHNTACHRCIIGPNDPPQMIKFLKVTDFKIWKNKIQTIQCQEIYSDLIPQVADGLQMAHIRPPHRHYWYISSFPTMAARLASQQGWNQCYMSVFRMWLLASCCYLVQIVYTSQEFIKGSTEMEVAGPHNSTWACECLQLGYEDHSAYSTDLMSSDSHLYGPPEKQLADKWFATDTDEKQHVTSWLQIFQTSFWCIGIKALVHGGTNI